jgi:simple sugar transport system substrate-binding protein
LATFDLMAQILASIKAGETMAAIDQQPDLPGILGRQYVEVGLMPGQDIFTNPGVVNASNVDKVIEGAQLHRR